LSFAELVSPLLALKSLDVDEELREMEGGGGEEGEEGAPEDSKTSIWRGTGGGNGRQRPGTSGSD